MYCKQCGKEIAPGTRFCAGCGAAIGKATPRLALTRGNDRKIWLFLGAVVGLVFLGVSGTFVVDNWLENPSTNAVPKSVEDLRAVDLASLVFQPNDLPLEKAGLVTIENTRWVATAEDVRSLPDHTGNDVLNLYHVLFGEPSEPHTAEGMIAVNLYANVLSAQNQYQKSYDSVMKTLDKTGKFQKLDVLDVGERAEAVIDSNKYTFFWSLRCHAAVSIYFNAAVSPDAVLAYGKRLDERLRTAACP